MLGQLVAVGAEGVGLDDLRSGFDVFAVDFATRAGLLQVEQVKTVFKTDAALVQHGAHGAIREDGFAGS